MCLCIGSDFIFLCKSKTVDITSFWTKCLPNQPALTFSFSRLCGKFQEKAKISGSRPSCVQLKANFSSLLMAQNEQYYLDCSHSTQLRIMYTEMVN